MAAFDGAFMLPLGVSAVTLGFGLLVTLDGPPLDLGGSPWLVPLAQALVALPLVVRTVAPVLRGVAQRQRDAAATLGAGPVRVFLTVDLAAAWRPVLAAAGFAFAVSLGEFGATSFLARPQSPTLPVLIYQLLGRPEPDSFGTALAASVVLGAFTAGVMVAVERLRPDRTGAW
jgi:thiamine transport system permease protein